MNIVKRLEPMALPLMPAPIASAGVLDMVKTYRRRLPTFLSVALLIFSAVALYTLAQTPRFTARTSVVVTPRKAEIGSDRSSPLSDPTTDASIDTQVEILRNPALATIVVDRLHLDQPAGFDRLTRTPGRMARWAPFLARRDTAPPATPAQCRAQAIDRLQQGLDIRRVAQTFVLELAFSSPDRVLAAQIVNGFAAAYVQQSLDLKLGDARSAGGMLSGQLATSAKEVQGAEAAVGSYRIAHNLMSVGGSTVAEQELTNFDQQVAQAKASQAEAIARHQTAVQQMQRGSNGEDVGEALGSPVVQELRRQRAEASRRLAELNARYGPRYPAIAGAQQQLADVDAQIQSEVGRILSNLDAQGQVASRRTSSLEGSMASARSAVAGNNVAAVRLGELQSRAIAARTQYEALLARVREIGTQAATTQADARITSPAAVPVLPTAPNIPINLLVGALLAIAGGIAAVVLRQGLDQGLSTLDDVQARLNLPYLAGLPTLASSVHKAFSKDPVAALVDHRTSAYAEGFRTLGASVLQGGATNVHTIVLTSALPNEGKTTAAIGLARVLAMSGRSVVLVDADLRRPRIARALRIQPDVGLRELLDGEIALDEALVRDAATGAMILPMVAGGSFATSPVEDGRFERLLATLKMRFDVVVLDVSPVLPVVDGRLIAKMADAVILLVRWRKTPEPAVEMATHLLRSVGASLSGVALSRVDLQVLAKSGYGDPAQFLKMYQGYYEN